MGWQLNWRIWRKVEAGGAGAGSRGLRARGARTAGAGSRGLRARGARTAGAGSRLGARSVGAGSRLGARSVGAGAGAAAEAAAAGLGGGEVSWAGRSSVAPCAVAGGGGRDWRVELLRVLAWSFARQAASDGSEMKKGRRRSMKVDLAAEAKVLSPLVSQWKQLYHEQQVDAASFAGAYVLAYLSVRHGRWTAGRLDPQMLGGVKLMGTSCPVRRFPGLPELLGDLSRWFGEQAEVSILDVLASLRLDGIKKNKDCLANRSLVSWLAAARPFLLMFRIPSPLEVLRMQARGQRVVTMLTSEEDMSGRHTAPLRYMEGDKLHSRDALEFLVHDLAHMEKFVAPEVYEEQVGFFRSMLELDEEGPRRFLERFGGDEQLWAEVEYCISDMNCCCTHLLKYLKAKLLHARDRCPSFLFHACWAELLRSFGVARGSKEEEALEGIGFRAMREEESDCIRRHFKARAKLSE